MTAVQDPTQGLDAEVAELLAHALGAAKDNQRRDVTERLVTVRGSLEAISDPLASNTSVRAKNTLRPAAATRPSADSSVPIAACPVKRQSRSSVTARPRGCRVATCRDGTVCWPVGKEVS